jgi:hypothetical protein
MRDRRWDFLHDRQRRPVKEWIVERLGEELAADLSTWPLPLEWTEGAAAQGLDPALSGRPPATVMRLALEIARRDLARDFDGAERLAADGAERRAPADQAALRLVARFVSERCLAQLTRADLAAALDQAERRLFRVTER